MDGLIFTKLMLVSNLEKMEELIKK